MSQEFCDDEQGDGNGQMGRAGYGRVAWTERSGDGRPRPSILQPVHPMRWTDDENLQVGDTHFLLTVDRGMWESQESGPDRFVLLKTRRMLESLLRMAPDPVETVVDLGIYKGGSIALLLEVFAPKRLLGIDHVIQREQALDRFVAERALYDAVHLYYGTDQGNTKLLTRIVDDTFGHDPLDLVIDDCSHMYEPTRASLNVLLPRLRPGGVYAIEDWGWAHWPEGYREGAARQFVDERTALSTLILELVMVSASRPGLIEEVSFVDDNLYLVRGTEEVTDPDFDISASYRTSGRKILAERQTGIVWRSARRVDRLVEGLRSRPLRPDPAEPVGRSTRSVGR